MLVTQVLLFEPITWETEQLNAIRFLAQQQFPRAFPNGQSADVSGAAQAVLGPEPNGNGHSCATPAAATQPADFRNPRRVG